MAYVYKRGKSWWIGYVDKNGEPKRQSAKTTNKTRAQQMAEELEHKHRRIAEDIDPDTVVSPPAVELVAEYLKGPVKRNRSFETVEQRLADHFVAKLGTRRADQVTPHDINELLNKMLEEGYAPQTAEHVRIAISGVYTYGVEKLGVVRDNPAARAEPVKIPEHEPKVLDSIHIPALVANVYGRWRNLFATAVYTGLRKGELLGLLTKCVDLEGRRVLVLHSYKGQTKSGKPRVVPIPEELLPFLEEALRLAGEAGSEYLFHALDGGMQNRNANLPRTFRNALKKANIIDGYRMKCRRRSCAWAAEKLVARLGGRERCPKCGFLLFPKKVPLDLSFKDLRSTYGTYMYEATDDIRFVQRVLGHHDPKLTERIYAKLTAKRLVEQANRLKLGVTHTGLTSTKQLTDGGGYSEEKDPETSAA